MQWFEMLVIMFGIATGALMPLLPDPTAKERPIGAILWFSLAIALAIFFMPFLVLVPVAQASAVILFTFVGGAAGFFAVRAIKLHGAMPKITPRPHTPAKHHA